MVREEAVERPDEDVLSSPGTDEVADHEEAVERPDEDGLSSSGADEVAEDEGAVELGQSSRPPRDGPVHETDSAVSPVQRPDIPSRKRKRSDRDDHLENRYMSKMAKEEAKEDLRRRTARRRTTQEQPDDDDEEEDDDGPESSQDDRPSTNGALPLHESLAPSKDEDEVEKASRTVFLANVSTLAITSKASKKTLLEHLSSFQEPNSSGLAKVQSLRFRSTAFSSTAVPKKAAFAKKELMGATTKSTNAYAVYANPLTAREAVRKLNGSVVLDRHLRVDGVAHPSPADHRRCVFVGNLGFVDDESSINAANSEHGHGPPKRNKAARPADAEEGLWRQFERAGTVENVRVVRDSKTRVGKGFAYVQFTVRPSLPGWPHCPPKTDRCCTRTPTQSRPLYCTTTTDTRHSFLANFESRDQRTSLPVRRRPHPLA